MTNFAYESILRHCNKVHLIDQNMDICQIFLDASVEPSENGGFP
mgnify:CR=1 FL=1